MKYRAFDSYQIGFSHVKKGSGCEDYALSYSDPFERFYICVACDGHSDNNCFRSAKGAKFGCEAAVEVLTRFFELYFEEGMTPDSFSAETENRLKKSLKQCWDNKVQADLRENPLTQEEMEPLTERVRNYYEAGRGLSNIYGATFLAAAMAKNCFIALHIGDGALMCIEEDGSYYDPLPYDEKSSTGGPASLCDSDLFTRENAFGCIISPKCPQAVIVSSDGIEDCMDDLQFKELIYSLFMKFEFFEEQGCSEVNLNDSQQKYLDSCVRYWAAQGHGVEDDCSLAGIYTCGKEAPKVKISLEQAESLWNATVEEHNEVLKDYERRKRGIIASIDELFVVLKRTVNTKQWIATKQKIEELKQILRTMDCNEKDKKLYYDSRLQMCGEYIKRANGAPISNVRLIKISSVDNEYLEEDADFLTFKNRGAQEPTKGVNAVDVPTQPKDEEAVDVVAQPKGDDTVDEPVQLEDEEAVDVPVQLEDEEVVDMPTQPEDEEAVDVPVQPKDEEAVDVLVQLEDEEAVDVSVQLEDEDAIDVPVRSQIMKEGSLAVPLRDASNIPDASQDNQEDQSWGYIVEVSVKDDKETNLSVEGLKAKKSEWWDGLNDGFHRLFGEK